MEQTIEQLEALELQAYRNREYFNEQVRVFQQKAQEEHQKLIEISKQVQSKKQEKTEE